jgi:hypothetical protein
MIHLIATISPPRAGPFILRGAIFDLVAGLAGFVGLSQLLRGEGQMVLNLVVLAIVLFVLRNAVADVLIFIQSRSRGRPALWVDGDRLIYLAPWYASLPVKDVDSVEQKLLPWGFSRQPYAVIRTRSGKRMNVFMPIITERLDHLKELLAEQTGV